MTIRIKGKDIELNFGIEFVHRLDKFGEEKLGKETAETVGFGCGLAYCVPYIMAKDYYVLAVLLYEATWHVQKSRPSLVDIENYLDTIEDLNGFKDTVIDELKKSNACVERTMEMERQMDEAQAKTEEGLRMESTKN